MRVIYRYAFRKFYEPKFAMMTLDELMELHSPGLREQLKVKRQAQHEAFLKSLKPRTPRPTDLRALVIHDHNHDFHIQWYANFKKKELLVFTHSCWPPALVDFLMALPTEDERFAAAGIFTPLHIEDHFKIKICLEYKGKEKWYLAHVYESFGCLEINMEALPSKKRIRANQSS